jgi:hypothetical protein
MIEKYIIKNWSLKLCNDSLLEFNIVEDNYFLIVGDYENHPFLKEGAFVPKFAIFDKASKEGMDVTNNNIFKLENFVSNEYFESENLAIDYIESHLT